MTLILPTRTAPSELVPRLHKSTLHIADGRLADISLRLAVPRALAGPASEQDLRDVLAASFQYISAELQSHFLYAPEAKRDSQLFFEQTDRFHRNHAESGFVRGSLRHVHPTKDEAYLRVVARSDADLDRVYSQITDYFGFIPPRAVSQTNALRVDREYRDCRAARASHAALGVPKTI